MACQREGEVRPSIDLGNRAMGTLKETQTGMSLAQIAAKLDLPRSTVQRIVTALQDERLVIASATGGGLRLGPELHALAGAARYDIVERCRPFLNDLAQTTAETVDLSVLRGARIIFLDQVQGTHRLRTISCDGEVFLLTTTANGRACLSLLPDADIARRAKAEWAQQGVNGDLPALQTLLAEVRKTGLAAIWMITRRLSVRSALPFVTRRVICIPFQFRCRLPGLPKRAPL